jgi:OmpA-OmpF porin, OOP family
MTLKKALLAATILALPVAAQAQPVSGLYVGAGVGGNYRTDPTDGGIKAKTKIGWATVGSIGYGFGNGLRAEVEGNYRTNDVKSWNATGGRAPGSGRFDTYGVMGNVLYDFNFGSPFVPYIGAGAGYVWSDIAKARVAGARIEHSEANFAYQGIAGAAYNFGGGVAMTLEYRYLASLENTYGVRQPTLAATPNKVAFDNQNHSVMLGLRYAFNAPAVAAAAVVAPVAAPTLARTYLVFFDWDKANLTERAKQIITEAAGAARKTATTRIEVAGHADRSGTPAYNQKLSQRRADAVAAELVRQGIARNEIAISAYGESRPLVPTADGVREPQNRRVEIVLK